MTRITVGITGMNATDNPGPGVGIARSLQEDADLDVQIVGLAYDAMEPGIYIDWLVDKSYILPYPSKGGEAFLERIRDIQKRHGLDWIIPSLDAELPLLIKYADELADSGTQMFLPDMEQFQMRGKDRLPEVAKNIDISMPATRVIASEQGLAEAVEEIGLPVMLKGVFYQAYMARSLLEAAGYFRKLVAEWGYPIIVQQVVAGDELNVIGVGDGTGNSLGLVGVKKTSVTSLGKVWSAVTVNNRPMLDAAERFVQKYKWRGPFELECIVNRDGVHLIEINPRFPAWVYFATGVGINLPARMLHMCLGHKPPTNTDYPPGKLFIRYTHELVTDMSLFQMAMTQGETKSRSEKNE